MQFSVCRPYRAPEAGLTYFQNCTVPTVTPAALETLPDNGTQVTERFCLARRRIIRDEQRDKQQRSAGRSQNNVVV